MPTRSTVEAASTADRLRPIDSIATRRPMRVSRYRAILTVANCGPGASPRRPNIRRSPRPDESRQKQRRRHDDHTHEECAGSDDSGGQTDQGSTKEGFGLVHGRLLRPGC